MSGWERQEERREGEDGRHAVEAMPTCADLCFLSAEGIVELFPVQAAVWHLTAGGLSRVHDVCICAPTGSGKTLAYALPMVHCLAR